MKLCLSILVVLLFSGATGCQFENGEVNPQGGGATSLVETPQWRLHRMISESKEWDLSLDSKLQRLVPDSEVTIAFAPTRMHGNTGCNHFSGTYVGKPDGTFQCRGDGVTEMPCPGKLEAQQAELLRLLALARRWQINDGVLTLSDGTGVNQLEFVPY